MSFLTSRTTATTPLATDLIHIVKSGDTSQNPAGSSYKIPMGTYDQIFNFWSASTGTNAIVTKFSGSYAGGMNSLAHGYQTSAMTNFSYSEGYSTKAFGSSSHAEGQLTVASGTSSHAEGSYTTAIGIVSHAEGSGTQAIGNYSHAGGNASIASGNTSFVHGTSSTAGGTNTIVLGANIIGLANNTTYVDRLSIKTYGPYANDTAADNDTTLPSGGLYTLSTGNPRAIYRKP